MTERKRDSEDSFQRAHDEAAKWVVKKSQGLSPEEREAYEEWLAADPSHEERVSANQQVWDDAEALKEMLRGPEGELRLDALDPPGDSDSAIRKGREWWRRAGAAALAAACVALAFLALYPRLGDTVSGPQSFQSEFAAQTLQRHFLPDGSLIELRENAAVEVRYDAARRFVRLNTGEAHFSVADNPDRPFVVAAGESEFQAVGTAFSVRVEQKAVNLLVTEGRVRLSPAKPPVNPALETIGGSVLGSVEELVAKQLAVIERNGQPAVSAIKEVSEGEIDERLSWKREIFDFNATPLSKVIEAFNRRNRDQLVLRDAALGQVKIDGSFRSDNLPAFVRLIEITAGIKAERSASERIVLYLPHS